MFNEIEVSTIVKALAFFQANLDQEIISEANEDNLNILTNETELSQLEAKVQSFAKADTTDTKKTIRELMDQSDSISFGDVFYRHISPHDEDGLEYVFDFNDERYEFTSDSLDNAKLDDGCWSAYCSYNKQHVDINFYEVNDITSLDILLN
jgi:hypothetical protein